MALDGDVVLLQELADGKVLVNHRDVYRIRVKLLKLPDKLVRLIEARVGKVSIEEGTQSVGGHRKGGGVQEETV